MTHVPTNPDDERVDSTREDMKKAHSPKLASDAESSDTSDWAVGIEETEDLLDEQPAPRNSLSCWMALLLLIIAACLLVRVFCFNLSVLNVDPIPLH